MSFVVLRRENEGEREGGKVMGGERRTDQWLERRDDQRFGERGDFKDGRSVVCTINVNASRVCSVGLCVFCLYSACSSLTAALPICQSVRSAGTLSNIPLTFYHAPYFSSRQTAT